MKVMSYNTLFGGFDGNERRRFDAQIKLINEVSPDILLVQELKGFLHDGMKPLFNLEQKLGMRGFLAPAVHTGQNTGVFIRPYLTPVAVEADSVHFHHALASVTLNIPGADRPLTVLSAHLCPYGPHIRLREASYLVNYADDAAFTLVAGDFNSVSPHDSSPIGLDALPPRFRARYVAQDGEQADTNVMATLYRAGFVDIAHKLEKHNEPTVPAAGYKDTEFVPFRSDYLLATEALAACAASYSVVKNSLTDFASDHYPIVAEFTL